MNQYQAMYQEKLTTVHGAVAKLRSGDDVVASFSANEPVTFFSHLHEAIHNGVENLTAHFCIDQKGDYPFLNDEYRGGINLTSSFMMAAGRQAYANNNMGYIPGHLHNFPVRYSATHNVTVLVMSVCPMDEHGYFRCSLDNTFIQTWRDNNPRIILEVNDQMPVVYGENEIHIRDVEAVFETSHPLPTIQSPVPGEVEMAIGRHVATLVNDGDTIQLGIGMIPNAVADFLKDKKELGIHTEMITSAVVDLVECGAVTGRNKTLHKGRIVGTFALGDQRLYDFLTHNPSIEILPGRYVNNPFVIAQNDNMVSINTSLAVDFYGQVCSESIGPRPYSGTGGQNDTAEGAIHAKNGRSIIALRSTAKNGAISTITPTLAPGSVVTMSANNIDYIVTEYGVAQMKGQTLIQRAQNLINVAHPKFREELTAQAKELGRLR